MRPRAAGSVRDHHRAAGAERGPAGYIFAWAADADGSDSDFLAVIDGLPSSPTYGKVLSSLPVGVKKTNAHHTEPQMPADGLLLANGLDAGVTFRFD